LGVSRRGRRAPGTLTSREDNVTVQSPILITSTGGDSLVGLIIPVLRVNAEQQERSIHRNRTPIERTARFRTCHQRKPQKN
jgi:hypothetical protein